MAIIKRRLKKIAGSNKPDFIEDMTHALENVDEIDSTLYPKYNVKRGLRNPDGTGVMAGVTNICNVHGYVVNEGEKQPCQGELIFRGYNIRDLIGRAAAEDRFGYEETIYLLLTGKLPNKTELDEFKSTLCANRALPDCAYIVCT